MNELAVEAGFAALLPAVREGSESVKNSSARWRKLSVCVLLVADISWNPRGVLRGSAASTAGRLRLLGPYGLSSFFAAAPPLAFQRSQTSYLCYIKSISVSATALSRGLSGLHSTRSLKSTEQRRSRGRKGEARPRRREPSRSAGGRAAGEAVPEHIRAGSFSPVRSGRVERTYSTGSGSGRDLTYVT